MQSEMFQAFICYNFVFYNFDDYGSHLMKTSNKKSKKQNKKLFIDFMKSINNSIIKIITNKDLKYLALHVMRLCNILVSPFKLNY